MYYELSGAVDCGRHNVLSLVGTTERVHHGPERVVKQNCAKRLMYFRTRERSYLFRACDNLYAFINRRIEYCCRKDWFEQPQIPLGTG